MGFDQIFGKHTMKSACLPKVSILLQTLIKIIKKGLYGVIRA